MPLNSEAIAVLRERLGKHSIYCFTYRGKKVTQVNTKAWRNGLVKAGIPNFRWHGLRHTWASWHVQNGTPISVLQELGGWSEIKMVQRYAHLAPEHLAPHAENICEKNANGTFLATPQKGTKKAALHLVK